MRARTAGGTRTVVLVERRPDPAPLETNDVALVAAGTALWAVALVVLLVLKAIGKGIHDWWWQMCLAGALLGTYGVRYCVRRRNRLRAG
jgi:hypothetical protein